MFVNKFDASKNILNQQMPPSLALSNSSSIDQQGRAGRNLV